MEKPRIYLDLDRTLFDTVGSGQNYRVALKAIGVSTVEYDRIYNEYKSTLESSTDFDPEKVLDLLAENLNINREELAQNFWKKDNFVLFPKTMETLEKLSQNNDLRLFSEGNKNWQKGKIEKTEIGKFFDLEASLIEKRKLSPEVVAEIAQGAVVIDDKKEVIEQLASQRPDLHLVWINRNNEEELTGQNIRTIRDLSELLE